MKVNREWKRKHAAPQAHGQGYLFPSDDPSPSEKSGSKEQCEIIVVEKRRGGGMRYWCVTHGADATAKHGRRAAACRAAHILPVSGDQIASLDLSEFVGGVALWGAVPAVYDTSTLPMDRGIHVHARETVDAKKEIDSTFRAVRLLGTSLPSDGIVVSEIDAIYYMVSSVFGYAMTYIRCSHCGAAHLDRDWFSVHPHQRHLCWACGKYFRDSKISVGNPIVGIREACGALEQKTAPSLLSLDIIQADHPGGIQVWGSNPAMLWTSPATEAEGIHVHVYDEDGRAPVVDETYGSVTIDGITLDPQMVRTLMAQRALPSIRDRIRAVQCPGCLAQQFSTGDSAFTPTNLYTCTNCSEKFSAGRRKVIANPLPEIFQKIAALAPREPQQHQLDLLRDSI